MIFDMTDCGGCRTCEMACSFHNKGVFSFNYSSIRILDKGDEKGYLVELLEKNSGGLIGCDQCKNEEMPLCMQYCEHRESLEKILINFANRKNNKVNLEG